MIFSSQDTILVNSVAVTTASWRITKNISKQIPSTDPYAPHIQMNNIKFIWLEIANDPIC